MDAQETNRSVARQYRNRNGSLDAELSMQGLPVLHDWECVVDVLALDAKGNFRNVHFCSE